MNSSYRKKKTKKLNSSLVIISIITLTVVTLFSGVFIYTKKQSNSASEATPSQQEQQKQEDPLPAVKQENSLSEPDPTKEGVNQNNSTPQTKNVNVIIVDAISYEGKVEVRSFIPGVLQDGNCTISITKDSVAVVKESVAYADASSTVCTNPTILRSEFPSGGEWKVKVSFKSASYSGTSEERILKL